MRRPYEIVDVVEAGNGFTIAMDSRPLHTPAKRMLTMPTRDLAEAIAEEWRMQDAKVQPLSMPLTRLANTVIDRVTPQRTAVVDEIVAFGASDLVCYRAERPEVLAARQAGMWDPLVGWLARRHEAPLVVTTGVLPVEQAPATLARLRSTVDALADHELAPVHTLVSLTGSLVIGLALSDAEVTPDIGWAAAHVDETYQIELWGEDAEAAERQARRRMDFDDALRFLTLARTNGGRP